MTMATGTGFRIPWEKAKIILLGDLGIPASSLFSPTQEQERSTAARGRKRITCLPV